MLKGAEPIEVVTLLATLVDLFFDHRKRGATHQGGGATEATAKGGGFFLLIERLVNELGIGVRDEGLFPNKLSKLSPEDRKVIDEVIGKHDKRVIDRLRIVTVNVPNPPATIVKGKKEKKDKDGKVIEAGEPDREIPSDIDGGVEFLKSLIPSLKEKSTEEQLKVLENLNIAGKSQLFVADAMKAIMKKVAKAFGLSEKATAEEVVARIEQFIKGLDTPDPKKPRENDKAGMFMRFMRSITPGSFPNK